MNFNAVLINEINEQCFDLFNNKDEVNELISLNSFTPEKNNFLKNLYKIGYSRVLNKDKNKYIKLLTKAFQRRFRQDLVNGIIDEECLLISKNLTKNLK